MISSGIASAADDVAWEVRTASTTYFAGDWINLSIVGPRPSAVPFLYFNLSDPNGTLVDQRYIQVINGTVNFSYLLDLDAPQGHFLLNISSNDTLVAQVGFTVQFDELNYLSKRVAYQEKRLEDQARRLEVQRIANRELNQRVDAFWWVPYFGIGVVLFMAVSYRIVIEPVWMHWHNLGEDFNPQVTVRGRFLNVMANRYSPSELAAHYPMRRLVAPDPKAVALISERARNHPFSPFPPKPVKTRRFRRRSSQ